MEFSPDAILNALIVVAVAVCGQFAVTAFAVIGAYIKLRADGIERKQEVAALFKQMSLLCNSFDKLAAAFDKISDRQDDHEKDCNQRHGQHEHRITVLEQKVDRGSNYDSLKN